MGRILACAAVVLCGCGSGSVDTEITGTVVFLDQQGGFFGVVGDDGLTYEPTNLDASFAVDGMRIRFRTRFLDEGPWGKRVELRDVGETGVRPPGAPLVLEGTVSFIQLEGGFFAILGDDGGEYDPINLPTRFAVDGLRVAVTMRIRTDLASAHLWGWIVEIDEIEAAS